MGILILSTSKGLMTDREARYRRIGGEIVCSVLVIQNECIHSSSIILFEDVHAKPTIKKT